MSSSIFKKTRFIKKMITIKGRFIDLILEGRKTTTIRLGRVIPLNDELYIQSGGRIVAKIKVKHVEFKKIKDLTDEDARRDGFRSLRELIKNLKNVYQMRVSPDDIVTIIEFEVLEKLDIPTGKKYTYMGFELREIAELALKHYENELTDEERNVLMKLKKLNSIRATAYELYGTVNRRPKVRRILRKYFEKMIKDQIINIKTDGRISDTSKLG